MAHCPTCGAEIAPQSSPASNAGATVPVEIPVALLSSVESALAIGRNAALMNRENEAQDGLEALRLIVEAKVPPAARHFSDGAWAAIIMRISAGAAIDFEVIDIGRSWDPKFLLRITDRSGTEWPRANFRTPNVLDSAPSPDRAEIETLHADLLEIAARLAPME